MTKILLIGEIWLTRIFQSMEPPPLDTIPGQGTEDLTIDIAAVRLRPPSTRTLILSGGLYMFN